MAIIHHEKTRKGQFIIILYRAYILDFLLDFLKLNMGFILLSKLNTMMESACLSSKPFRNASLQKMAIIYYENSRERPIYRYYV